MEKLCTLVFMDKDIQADKSKVLAWFAKKDSEDKKKKPDDYAGLKEAVAKGDPRVKASLAKAFGN